MNLICPVPFILKKLSIPLKISAEKLLFDAKKLQGMIKIENLTKFYGNTCAVDNISFEIHKGEILGLLGPNGAGKTSIMRILTSYLQPSSGVIDVKEFNIYDHALDIRKLIGYLPESAPLYPEMLVYDYLRFVAEVREVVPATLDARMRELADICSINEVMHRPVSELSKGYKQRVGLAHAMMNDPEILVLDEPTSGLDPNQIVEIRDIIRRVGKEKTVVLSTHILSEAEATCDRIVIINRGKIVAEGSTEELKREAGSEYILEVSLTHTDFDGVKDSLRSINGINDVIPVRAEDGQLDFHIACSGERDIRADVYKVIREKKWPLLEFHLETRTLEHIFRELTTEN
jgi:ABC-2 type transport system ATP-binding protein